MCLFNFPNKSSIKAKEKGILEFECGSCPECLQKKSRLWALRCSMEAKVSLGVMVTLTYDTYKVIYGKTSTIEENPTDPTIPLSKRDCQLFMKRLRKHFAPQKIKYLITAERGKRTGRAHYHALLFGVVFDDLIKYKRSDRGNWIYKSKTLEKIWQKGICTVDCINLSAKTARYCTKYCAKDSGVDDTFMLFSHGIGESELLKRFNGKSYWIEGREYTIPKKIWQLVIENKYRIAGYSKYSPLLHLEDGERLYFNEIARIEKKREILYENYLKYKAKYEKKAESIKDFRKQNRRNDFIRILTKYKSKMDEYMNKYSILPAKDDIEKRRLCRLENRGLTYARGKRRNEYFQMLRDNDTVYIRYLTYWSNKVKVFEKTRPSPFERILNLPINKYRSYRQKALICKIKQNKHNAFVPPRSNCFAFCSQKHEKYKERTFAPLSRHYRANDTIEFYDLENYMEEVRKKAKLNRLLTSIREIEKEISPF